MRPPNKYRPINSAFLRKAGSVLLLLLLCVNVCGLVVLSAYFHYQGRRVAEKLSSQKSHANLIVFTNLDSNKDVVWQDKEDEFSLRGMMYDVVRKEVRQGVRYYYCVEDKKEALVSGAISRQASLMNGGGVTKDVEKVVSWVTQIFIPVELVSLPKGRISDFVADEEFYYNMYCPNPIPDIFIPPPKRLS